MPVSVSACPFPGTAITFPAGCTFGIQMPAMRRILMRGWAGGTRSCWRVRWSPGPPLDPRVSWLGGDTQRVGSGSGAGGERCPQVPWKALKVLLCKERHVFIYIQIYRYLYTNRLIGVIKLSIYLFVWVFIHPPDTRKYTLHTQITRCQKPPPCVAVLCCPCVTFPWSSYLGALGCTWLWVYLVPGTDPSVCPAVSVPVPHQEPAGAVPACA